MKKCIRISIFIFLSVCFIACGSENNGARLHLESARTFYLNKDYNRAKQEIDSIRILYPKSVEERRQSLLLLDSVRYAENYKVIADCDSLINLFQPEVEETKKQFAYQRDKRYQETGAYIPKESFSDGYITGTNLRSGVTEEGLLFLESVFVGSSQKHNSLKLSTKDGLFIQSGIVTEDGANYRFTNMGKSYEVIRFTGISENGMAKFIFSNVDKPLTATLSGAGNYSFVLSNSTKKSIAKSFQLSTLMLELDSLKTTKEKAEFHIYNLDKKKGEIKDDIVGK
ncbi:MAG: hypothetical protein E6767_03320 [Dysgonomonas sp.]|nr:hypothetical protein [Dysgonomonas sp.]